MNTTTQSNSDLKSYMILRMEKKLNPSAFWRRYWKHDKYCKITTSQFWDWLVFVDV
jgi:hypothetical protein